MATQSSAQHPKGGKWPTLLAWLSVLALLGAAILMGLAGPAYRWELIALGDAFSLLRYGVYVAAAAGALSLLLLIAGAMTRRFGAGVVAIVVFSGTVALLYLPWQHWQRAQQAPMIHDITTDTQNPPAFDALRDARDAAPNAVDYPGEETARQQQEAYPEVEPLVVSAPAPSVLGAAQAEVEAAGWQIETMTDNTIEATATTPWFGFKDDVVIRLTEQENGVRVDMRSASRLGASDVGTNALRIETFLDRLGERFE
ncbi:MULTISPECIES: DUF1499 domain-containing protein [Halomonadaceae]|uniref:DUF1499 domain-containing protein n=1 Tax=Vreelandella janggokensis TaxID=370767 RepID=A0ABT4IRW7_9GAMM|nr:MULTISPECIES: DUF1499 domain-containing protein [Halomonas]MCW4153193.1 DUF1499 domain-containing protein [Halomonas sp. 18H]MCZ0925906.1 DUF1499 domain-containing protein [Halomonas janggokensis]MCZ0930973.1 DUF1499 domain-containing protein [Halomonas janggokensis]MDR5886363.1 DUF1499 domain-containing protein [Halomonas janggokensis]QPL47056.1 DUF1499 domain-containing protein [Halomonas sp. A40-4]